MYTNENLSYFIKPELIEPRYIIEFFSKNPNIKFVSLFGVDIVGHDTDEKIPKRLFLNKLEDIFLDKPFLQTDGSSIALSELATLSDCKVDMIADRKSIWYVDYNFENTDLKTGLPTGTLRIPAYLYHNGKAIGSRALLKRGESLFKQRLIKYMTQQGFLKKSNITERIAEISINIGTELEFWVKTPTLDAQINRLQTAQSMQENYWQRTKGRVRTALENSLLLLELYGLEPEMGHKEVGGVKAAIGKSGDLNYVMEQIEVDWKYSKNPLEAADKELLARITIKETFRRHGLDVSFDAKPIENVAGNGEHIHIGIAVKTESGRVLNLFSPFEKKDYLNSIGYGALMGILTNYGILSAFISPSNDALNRLKPDFEAPVSSVCSLGVAPGTPSRNRTVLIGLISDLENEMARRFELRAANPHTNLYISLSAVLMCMLEGIAYACESERSEDELLSEISKQPGEFYGYLNKAYAFRAEKNIFKDYTQQERDRLFGPPPRTVYELVHTLKKLNGTNPFLKEIFSEAFVESYCSHMLRRWKEEVCDRIIPSSLHQLDQVLAIPSQEQLDTDRFEEIERLLKRIVKDDGTKQSLRTQIKEAGDKDELERFSELFLEFTRTTQKVLKLYKEYKENFIC